MSELLANYEIDAPRRREMNAIVNDEVKRLTRMIDDYLDIARLQSGRAAERREPVRIEPLIDRLLLLYAPIAAPKQCELIYESGAPLPAVLADADLLNRAIGNLISNAIKYSPNGRQVRVRTAADGQFLQIDVEDQGYGIPPEDQEKIFDKFYRVPRVEDADTPGTGLGLAFTREIAALHGGTVAVQSELGAGSTFTFRLPIGLAL
jgi:signal transduction histidine kinase